MTCLNYRYGISVCEAHTWSLPHEYLSLLQVFKLERIESKLDPLRIQSDLTVKEMLERVLRLPAVASKRYLTNKVC